LLSYYYYYYYYVAGCAIFSHLPASIWQLYYHLPAGISVIPLFFLQSFLSHSHLIPSAQVGLGLPRFLLPGGRHFITSFGKVSSSIPWTWPYNWCCFVLISLKRHCYLHFLVFNSIPKFVLPKVLAEHRQ